MEAIRIVEFLLYVLGKGGYFWLAIYALYALYGKTVRMWVFVAGFVLNDVLNRVLKMVIREERPQPWTSDKSHYLYYGMPSGHAQHMFFIATFLYLQGDVSYMPYVWILCFIVVFERIYSKQHTWKQVLVGACIGTTFAYMLYKNLPFLTQTIQSLRKKCLLPIVRCV